MQKPQNTISPPQPKNVSELELLKDYSSYLMEQVNDMKLHPAHKEDIKEILLKAMVQIVIVYETKPQISKTQRFFLRMLRKQRG
jgi:hypothetical protein